MWEQSTQSSNTCTKLCELRNAHTHNYKWLGWLPRVEAWDVIEGTHHTVEDDVTGVPRTTVISRSCVGCLVGSDE